MVYLRISSSIKIHTSNKLLENYTKPGSTDAGDFTYITCDTLNNGTQKHVNASDSISGDTFTLVVANMWVLT